MQDSIWNKKISFTILIKRDIIVLISKKSSLSLCRAYLYARRNLQTIIYVIKQTNFNSSFSLSIQKIKLQNLKNLAKVFVPKSARETHSPMSLNSMAQTTQIHGQLICIWLNENIKVFRWDKQSKDQKFKYFISFDLIITYNDRQSMNPYWKASFYFAVPIYIVQNNTIT